MIRSSMLMIALMIWLTPAPSAEEGKHLFILSGQSNMERLDPDSSFKPAVEAAFGSGNVIIVKDAKGAQPIRRWYKAWKPASGELPGNHGDLYQVLIGKVKDAIAGQQIASITFIWMQGERDAKEGHGEVYAGSLKGLVKQFVDDLQREDINVVIGRINDFQMSNSSYPHWTMIREVQLKTAQELPRADWVDTDDLNDDQKDPIHATKAGFVIMGKRFAEKAIALINANGGKKR